MMMKMLLFVRLQFQVYGRLGCFSRAPTNDPCAATGLPCCLSCLPLLLLAFFHPVHSSDPPFNLYSHFAFRILNPPDTLFLSLLSFAL